MFGANDAFLELHQVCSKSNDWNAKYIKSLWERENENH